MNVEIDGVELVDLVAMAEIAGVVGGIVSMLVIAILIYLLVRPPRHVRGSSRRPALADSEADELLSLMDRMESRLAVLERPLADDTKIAADTQAPVLQMADEGLETKESR